MAAPLPPPIPPNLQKASEAIVRQVEKQNTTPRDQGKAEREAEAKRQRNAPNQYGTSGKK